MSIKTKRLISTMFVICVFGLLCTSAFAEGSQNIDSLLKNGVTSVMWWSQWLVYAVGAVAIIMSAIKFVTHFKNHGKGQSQLVPAVALLIIGAMCVAGGTALGAVGSTGDQTLNDWAKDQNKTTDTFDSPGAFGVGGK